jgi:hypothetical protein
LRETGRTIEHYRQDVERLQIRHQAVADIQRADSLVRERRQLETDLAAAQQHFGEVQREAERMLAAARAPVLNCERTIAVCKSDERALRQSARKTLIESADPAIETEVESLREQRRHAERNSKDWVTPEKVVALRKQAQAALKEAEDLADSRGMQVLVHDRREEAERLTRQADAMEQRIRDCQEWAAKLAPLDQQIAVKEAEVFLPQRMQWSAPAGVASNREEVD